MKLMSMIEFVFFVQTYSEEPLTDLQILNKITSYAEFLKQPLTLGIFVPVDEKGNVLKEELKYSFATEESNAGIRHKNYREAQNKVLFEGFNIVKSDIETLNHTIFVENKKGEQVGYNKSWEDNWNFYGITIENLVGFELELSESALKQIGI